MDNQDSFTVYKEFTYNEPAEILMGLLKEEGIEYRLRNEAAVEQEVILGPESHSIVIMLKPEDHLRVDEIVEKRANSELDAVDKEYFIFSFDNDELRDVVVNSHEWTPLDLALAVKILKERGIDLDPDDVKKERAAALEESSKPIAIDKTALIFLYLLALFTSFIPLIAGIIFMTSKKPNSAGNRVPKYDIASRKHGRNLVLLGCISSIGMLYLMAR